MRRSLIAATLAVVAVGGLTLSGAQAASANSWTSFCSTGVYNDTTTETAPSQQMWCRVQGGPAAANGYTGTVDGVMGVNSWKGLQRHLAANFQYYGPIDGQPGTNTYKAMQRNAAQVGYAGPIDGQMGPNSWKYFNLAMKIQWFGL